MASGGTAVKLQRYTPGAEAPGHLRSAINDIGIQEWVKAPGGARRSNPVVEQWIEAVAGKRLDAIRTPWCAYWLGFRLQEDGHPSTKSGMARSYLSYGEQLDPDDADKWKEGDIVVLWRGRSDDGITGHVGFLLYYTHDTVILVGGNQGDTVSIQAFPRSKVIGVCRPRPLSASRTARTAGGSAVTGTVAEIGRQALPEPAKIEKVQETVTSAQGTFKTIAETLGAMKPWIIGGLTIMSIILALLALYYRSEDRNQGRNA